MEDVCGQIIKMFTTVEFTKTSRYHDQASIEDLAKKYSFQEFDKEINFMPWRILLANNPQEVVNSINNNNVINIANKPLVFLHTILMIKDLFKLIIFLLMLLKIKTL